MFVSPDSHATGAADGRANGHAQRALILDGRANGHDPAPLAFPWPAWIEVDLDAVEHNVRALQAALGERVALYAVVKAQAYGLGAVPVAEAALRAGAAGVAVARVEEGLELRRAGVESTILVLGPVGPGQEDDVVRWELTVTLADLRTAERLAAAANRDGKIVPVHIKADTGLARFGAQPYELLPLVTRVSAMAPLLSEGFYTHFAAADDDPEFTQAQLKRFFELRSTLHAQGHEFQLCHAASSAAMLRYPESRLDMVRIGITILGEYPDAHSVHLPGLRSALRFKGRVARVFDLPAGATVGYGRTYRVRRPTQAALIPTGYADGVPRAHSNRAEVLIRGERAPLIGRVSMDQCVADVTHLPRVEPDDEVVLIGPQGSDAIALQEFAGWSDTIAHEALTRLGARVPRVYFRSGQPVHVAPLIAEPADVPDPFTVR
jgi:alanine racemase